MAARVERSLPAGERRYRLRFLLAYAALAAVAVAAIGIAALLADEAREGSAAATSAGASGWAPEGEDLGTYPDQIAQQVAARYTTDEGRQLTGVLAGPPVIQEIPLRAISIERGSGAGESVPIELTVMYTLCGSGEGCTIAGGEASEERHLLVRRQVLELALYTFEHIEPVEVVLALLPPSRPDAPSGAVLLRRNDVARELGRPLTDTLSPRVPSAAALARSPEGETVDELTRPLTFDWEVQQLQDGSVTMRLVPIGGARPVL